MGGGEGGEGRGSQFVHGLSRMIIDPRIPTMPGRSTSGVQPGRHCLHQARSALRYSVSCMKCGTASFQEPLMRRGGGGGRGRRKRRRSFLSSWVSYFVLRLLVQLMR